MSTENHLLGYGGIKSQIDGYRQSELHTHFVHKQVTNVISSTISGELVASAGKIVLEVTYNTSNGTLNSRSSAHINEKHGMVSNVHV